MELREFGIEQRGRKQNEEITAEKRKGGSRQKSSGKDKEQKEKNYVTALSATALVSLFLSRTHTRA
jgi:hypothetical protein